MPNQTPIQNYLNILLGLTVGDWLIMTLNPQANAGNWLAGIAGAFILRLLLPGLSTRKHLSGWLVGTIAAFLWASTLHRKYLTDWDVYAVWGTVGFVADLLLQIIVHILSYARDNPGAAFDEGLARAGKFASVWASFKTPLLDIISLFNRNKPNPPHD